MDDSTFLLSSKNSKQSLAADYQAVRGETERICRPLATDDYQVQSMTETSPPKWHLAHVSWFFESFVLSYFDSGYRTFHPRFGYLFNSYYETVGRMQPRSKRGMLSRPTVEEIIRYRAYVDKHMQDLLATVPKHQYEELKFRVALGLQHEQQHQELLLMDIKHNLSVNPLRPAYNPQLSGTQGTVVALSWLERQGGSCKIGYSGADFAFDNETPRHTVLLQNHKLASRLVTNGEYLAFLADQSYQRPELWLADGWYMIQQQGWTHPLYWENIDGEWWQYTLGGMRQLDLREPVCHISYYEADAFARWAGKRLPTEAELETVLAEQPLQGNFLDHNRLHPAPGNGQWYGDVWEWTSSAYSAYPGFKPLAGSLGEYNGKFMSNQMVLRGGCCVTPPGHMRASYRNFYYPHDRWPFTGLRLAEDN